MDRILDLPLELAERCLVGDYLHPLLLTQLLLPRHARARARADWSTCSPRPPSRRRPRRPAPAGGAWPTPRPRRPSTGSPTCATWSSRRRASAAFSIAPGLTLTESMRASGMDEVLVEAGHVPAPPEVAGEVAAWLGDDPDAVRYAGQMVSSRKLCKESGSCPAGRRPSPPLTGPARDHRAATRSRQERTSGKAAPAGLIMSMWPAPASGTKVASSPRATACST